jgi:predicted amidohydrolase
MAIITAAIVQLVHRCLAKNTFEKLEQLIHDAVTRSAKLVILPKPMWATNPKS